MGAGASHDGGSSALSRATSAAASSAVGAFEMSQQERRLVKALGVTLHKLLHSRDPVDLADVLTAECKGTTLLLAGALRRELTELTGADPTAPGRLTSLLVASSKELELRLQRDPSHKELCQETAAFFVRLAQMLTALTLSVATTRSRTLAGVFTDDAEGAGTSGADGSGAGPNLGAASRGLPPQVADLAREARGLQPVPADVLAALAGAFKPVTVAPGTPAPPRRTLQLGASGVGLDVDSSLLFLWGAADGSLRVMHVRAAVVLDARSAGLSAPSSYGGLSGLQPTPTPYLSGYGRYERDAYQGYGGGAPSDGAAADGGNAAVSLTAPTADAAPQPQLPQLPQLAQPGQDAAPPSPLQQVGGADENGSPGSPPASRLAPGTYVRLTLEDVTSPACAERLCEVGELVVDPATGYVVQEGDKRVRKLLVEALRERFATLKPTAVPAAFFADERGRLQQARTGAPPADEASGAASRAVERRAQSWLAELRDTYDTGIRREEGPSPASYRAYLVATRLLAGGELLSSVCEDKWAGKALLDVPAYRALNAMYLNPLTGAAQDAAAKGAAAAAVARLSVDATGFAKTAAAAAAPGPLAALAFGAGRCGDVRAAQEVDGAAAAALRAAHVTLRGLYEAHFQQCLRLIAQAVRLQSSPRDGSLEVRLAPALFKHPQGAFGKLDELVGAARALLVEHFAKVEAVYRAVAPQGAPPAQPRPAAAVRGGGGRRPPAKPAKPARRMQRSSSTRRRPQPRRAAPKRKPVRTARRATRARSSSWWS
jgi:hypothetical protein